MKTIMVRYKTSEAHADANETLVRAVFNELRSQTPGGLRYATYRLADRVTFVHIATLETPDQNPLTGLPSFRAFQKELKDRCVELPVITEMTPVDSYGRVA
jgi:quinol monooxygenase YgiN